MQGSIYCVSDLAYQQNYYAKIKIEEVIGEW